MTTQFRLSVAGRLWWGVVLPTIGLVLWLAAVIGLGQGREFAPLVGLAVSIVAVPAAMLADCWTLFVRWRSRFLAFLGGLAVPAILGIGVAFFVHGTGGTRELGGALLAPFFAILKAVAHSPPAAYGSAVAWIVAMIALFLAARRTAA